MLTRRDEIDDLLTASGRADPHARLQAVVHLCPCHVRRNHDQVWDRLLAMATDTDPKVRGAVLHVLTDGSPRSRQPEVLQVLERFHHDSDVKLRRRARHILAHYRRTGELNIS